MAGNKLVVLDKKITSKLIHYEAARTALQYAKRVDEAKEIRDQAMALQAYAHLKKDLEMELWLAEIKLRATVRIGEISAGLEKAKNQSALPSGGKSKAEVLEEAGISTSTANRAEALAEKGNSEVIEQYIAEQNAAGKLITIEEAVTRVSGNVHFSSATDDWETPQNLFDELDKEFNFSIDVCASEKNAKCKKYFTKKDNGLTQKWKGNCWMNPPYGDEISEWIEKAFNSAEEGAIVVCLVPARVDTNWWWDYCRYGEIRFLRGRLKFVGAPANAPFPSAVIIFPNKPRVVWWEWQ